MSKKKVSPRQKMINLMYLIFIAMMVTSVDREVLRSFHNTNQTLELTSRLANDNNRILYENLQKKAEKDPEKYQTVYNQSIQVRQHTDQIFNQIESLKNTLITKEKLNKEEDFDYKTMESPRCMNKLFFEHGRPNEKALKFKKSLDEFRELMASISKSTSSKERIEKLFSTSPIQKSTWLESKFLEQPLIASITNLSKIQADMRNEESKTISAMLSEKLEKDISLAKFEALVYAPKMLMHGENIDAKIVLAADDSSLKTHAKVNGQNIPMKNGQAFIKMNTSSPGEKKLSGSINLVKENGEKKTYFFSYTYHVISDRDNRKLENKIYEKPVGGIISAEKMNIVYRGVDNPIIASIPGLSIQRLSLRANGGKLSQATSGRWIYRPGKGTTVDFILSGKTTRGETTSQKLSFRIKDLPTAQGTVRGETEPEMPARSLEKATISATIPGFEFQVNIIVSSFTIKIPGHPTIICQGNKLNVQAQTALEKVHPGTTITIGNINARLADENIHLKKISPIAVYING